MGFFGELFDEFGKQFDFKVRQAQGAKLVQDLVNYRQDRAQVTIAKSVAEAFRTENGPLLLGMLNEFGEQLKRAESFDFQSEVNELLWFFKSQVSVSLARGESIEPPSS